MALEPVKCAQHGQGQGVIVCRHLLNGTRVGFFSDAPTPENPWPDAWCAQCDDYFKRVPDWEKEPDAYLRFGLVCHKCYETIRAIQTG